ncbi:MAG: hypothetical protein QM652_06380 [Legionella sp.]|uniref:hypothetical protein n=1 Tax=Legionella sp. TaxID=459 RepID=UPI0039E58152
MGHTFLKSTIAVALFASSTVFAANATSGQLVIINSLGNVPPTGNAGSSASSVSVVVSDSTGPCSTTATLAYMGTLTVKWSSTATHSATSCTGITSVAVTPLKTTVGSISTIVYDSVTTTTIPATTATAPITYTPPTAAYPNITLTIRGDGIPAATATASATAWGIVAAAAPVFDAGNGSLDTVGIPGGSGSVGLKAESLMRSYAIIPHNSVVQ